MTLDFDLLLKAATFLMSAGAMFAAWIATRRKDVDARLATASDRIGNIERRTQRIEQQVEAMPGKDEVHRLQLSLSDISGDLRAIGATISGQRDILGRLEAIVTRHEDHLLEVRK